MAKNPIKNFFSYPSRASHQLFHQACETALHKMPQFLLLADNQLVNSRLHMRMVSHNPHLSSLKELLKSGFSSTEKRDKNLPSFPHRSLTVEYIITHPIIPILTIHTNGVHSSNYSCLLFRHPLFLFEGVVQSFLPTAYL